MQQDFRNYQGVLQPSNFPPLPSGWVSEWETFPAFGERRLQLFAVHHRRETPVVRGRALFVLHGLFEHGGRYLHFPHFLAPVVDSVYCLDFRGHGRSEGARGHADRFDLLVEDAALAIRRFETELMRRFGKAEIHLFAHSMGALVALRALAANSDLPVRSVTLSAPLLGIRVKVPAAKRAASMVLSKFWGSLQLMSELNPALLSHDQEVGAAYAADRLVHRKLTPRFFEELQKAMAATQKWKGTLGYPVQILQPQEDDVVDTRAVSAVFKRIKQPGQPEASESPANVLRSYPGFFHESFNEIGKEKVFEDIRAWIQLNADKSSSG